jgi:6-phosphogluconate dehydrogenase (decarboxylating)
VGDLSIGMVGLGVMGRNLLLHIEEEGFSGAAFDAWPDPVDRFVAEAQGKNIQGFKDIAAFVGSLARPRRVVMLVKAGEVVDKTIAALLPYLEAGDLLVDAGNEYFQNTERRAKELAPKGIRFFGMGVSGGEMGARHGPSLMPGGDRDAYEVLAPVLTKIAAQHADGPCVTYVGPGGAGHYAKMVHNGIEYGDMQLIAEAYDVLHTLGGLSNEELADVFAEWNTGELESFLIQITAEVLREKDPLGEGFLVDKILDATGMKGTGKWTVQDAAELAVALPTIATSVDARVLSARKEQRVRASTIVPGPAPAALAGWTRRLSSPTCARPSTRQKRAATPRGWTSCARPRSPAAGAFAWASSRASGRTAASSARGFSVASRRRSIASPSCPACSGIRASWRSSPRVRQACAESSRWGSPTVCRCSPRARRSVTTTCRAARDCLRTSPRLSATISARTRTVAPIGKGTSTPPGAAAAPPEAS